MDLHGSASSIYSFSQVAMLPNYFISLRQIKKNDKLKHLPVIIYTTSNNPIDEDRAKESGAEMFFTKTPILNY